MFVTNLAASVGRRTAARLFASYAAMAGTVLTTSFVFAPGAEAKGPGQTYCFYKTCHRVKTIAETQALVGRDMTVVASHYDSCAKDRFNPCGLTSSGERFAPERADNAASPELPDGTIALVWSKQSREAVIVRINNAGPYWRNRKLDLSRGAARKLGIAGVGEVSLRVLKAPTATEARYSKNRSYDPVPGPIGQFASLDAAHAAMSIMVAEGKGNTIALAGLALPAAGGDPAIDLASAYTTPLVPRLILPKGALANALITQSSIERRTVLASLLPATDIVPAQPANVNVEAVTPRVSEIPVAQPQRVRVRAVEVKPLAPDPLTAIAELVTSVIDPPPPVRRTRMVRKPPAKSTAVKVAAVAVKRPAVKQAATKTEPSQEYRAGFTTYAEDRHRLNPTTPAAAKSMRKVARANSAGTGSTAPQSEGAAPSRQALAGKGRKSAALRRAGGWQSSALSDEPDRRPALTSPFPPVPAGEWRNDESRPNAPRFRVHPSALV
jgi:rare lipoprotein A